MPTISVLSDWQQRVVREAAELDARIAKLSAFLDEKRCRVSGDDESILVAQVMSMHAYTVLLHLRISRFPEVVKESQKCAAASS